MGYELSIRGVLLEVFNSEVIKRSKSSGLISPGKIEVTPVIIRNETGDISTKVVGFVPKSLEGEEVRFIEKYISSGENKAWSNALYKGRKKILDEHYLTRAEHSF